MTNDKKAQSSVISFLYFLSHFLHW